jgi:hypothetical protein
MHRSGRQAIGRHEAAREAATRPCPSPSCESPRCGRLDPVRRRPHFFIVDAVYLSNFIPLVRSSCYSHTSTIGQMSWWKVMIPLLDRAAPRLLPFCDLPTPPDIAYFVLDFSSLSVACLYHIYPSPVFVWSSSKSYFVRC